MSLLRPRIPYTWRFVITPSEVSINRTIASGNHRWTPAIITQLRSLNRATQCDDPYPLYRELREHTPILYLAPLDLFLISRYDDVLALCRDRTVPTFDLRSYEQRWPACAQVERVLDTMATTPLYHRQPDHAPLRSAWARYITAPRIRGLEAFITHHVDHVLDDLARHGHDDQGIDFQQSRARELPMAVLAHIIGLPDTEVPRLTNLVHDAAMVFGFFLKPTQRQRLLDSHDQLLARFLDFIDYRRRHPDDRLTSSLLAAAQRSPSNTDNHIAATLAGMVIAGFESTSAALGNGTYAFATHSEQARLLNESPLLATDAVNEVLRWDPPFQILTRQTLNPIDMRGVRIPAGANLALLAGSANRDPDHYPEPDRFDITRGNQQPLSFGAGPHRCLGAHLARMEATIFFTRLTHRFPRLRLAGTPQRHAPGLNLRTFHSLPITLR